METFSLVEGSLAFGSSSPKAWLTRHSLSYSWLILPLFAGRMALGRCWGTRRREQGSPTQLTQG